MADTRITAISTTYDRDTISLFTDYLIGDRSGGSSFRAQVDEVVLGVLENIAENVGIGTASPGALLEVESAASTTGVIINNTAADGDPYLAFALSGTNTFTMGVDDGDSDKLKIGTTAIGTNTRLTIDSSGNVGIGTTSPDSAHRLHIISGGNYQLLLERNDSGNAGVRIVNSTTGKTSGDGLVIGVDQNERAFMWNYENTDLYFATNGTERVRVLSSGNVGIGTSSPGYKLHVNGSVAGTSAYVNLSDERSKSNIVRGAIGYGLETIMQLQPARFDYVDGPQNQLGFVAQDLQGIIPEMVVEDDEGIFSTRETHLIPVLVRAIQQLTQRLSALEQGA